MDVVDLAGFEFLVAALPADEVPSDESAEDEEREGGAPVYGRVAQEEVFDDFVIPAAHTEANVEDGPLPEVGSEIVLFVGIGDQGIVGSHHCNVEMDEVAEEGGFVAAWVARRHWK